MGLEFGKRSGPSEPSATEVGGRKGVSNTSKKGDSWWDSMMEGRLTKEDVRSRLLDVFESLSLAVGSNAQWDASEFDGMAANIVSLAERLPIIKLLFNLLAPFSIIAQAARKVRKLLQHRGPKQETQQANANVVNHPTNPPNDQGRGINRAFGG